MNTTKTGYSNTGYSNTGNWNTGDWNTGDSNTGNWNTGDSNTGYFNIDEPKVRIFGKETDIKRENILFPSFLYFDLTDWIYETDMTQEQKDSDENEYYKTTGGILIKYDYQEAFKKSYNSLSKEQKEIQTKQLRELPNFDADIFKQISGIDINNNEVEEMTMEQVCKELGRDIKIKK